MRDKPIYIDSWNYVDDNWVRLVYSDSSELYISRTCFNRSFQPIMSNPKETTLKEHSEDIKTGCE